MGAILAEDGIEGKEERGRFEGEQNDRRETIQCAEQNGWCGVGGGGGRRMGGSGWWWVGCAQPEVCIFGAHQAYQLGRIWLCALASASPPPWRPLPSARFALRSLVDLRDGRSPFVCTARYGPPLLRHSPSLLPTPLSSGERGGAFLQHIITSSQPLTRQNCASVAANHTRLHRRSHTNRSAGGSEP